jgi:hypothetical protein
MAVAESAGATRSNTQQNGPVPNSLYDPNWFYYVNGVANWPGPGMASTVQNGTDNDY